MKQAYRALFSSGRHRRSRVAPTLVTSPYESRFTSGQPSHRGSTSTAGTDRTSGVHQQARFSLSAPPPQEETHQQDARIPLGAPSITVQPPPAVEAPTDGANSPQLV